MFDATRYPVALGVGVLLAAGPVATAAQEPAAPPFPAAPSTPPPTTLAFPHLNAPVEIIRDRWGINHIYAETEYDLFFAQGYAAARDRLFQFEVWRAQSTGTVAAMLGPDELERDIGFRLFKYRGDMTAEMNHYHDRGSVIIPAYVDGVNAYIAETVTPDDYPHRDAIGFEWSDPYRWARASEVLGSGRLHSIADMMALQTDYHSIPARTLVPMLRHVTATDRDTERARQLLLAWDLVLAPESVAAGIYAAFEARLRGNVVALCVPPSARGLLRGMAMVKVIGHLTTPGGEFGDDPVAGRDAVLLRSLEEAVAGLRAKLGDDMDRWRYGQADYKHATIFHPLSRAAPADIAARLTSRSSTRASGWSRWPPNAWC